MTPSNDQDGGNVHFYYNYNLSDNDYVNCHKNNNYHDIENFQKSYHDLYQPQKHKYKKIIVNEFVKTGLRSVFLLF